MNVRPLGDRVFVQRIEQEEKTSSGLYLPTNSQEKPLEGMVKAVGPGKTLDNGKINPMSVNVGDRVLFSKFARGEVKLEGEDYLILREDEIHAIVSQ